MSRVPSQKSCYLLSGAARAASVALFLGGNRVGQAWFWEAPCGMAGTASQRAGGSACWCLLSKAPI